MARALLPASGDAVLDAALDPLRPIFAKHGLVEIVAGRPGELLLEMDDGRWQQHAMPALSLEAWRKILRTLAIWSGRPYEADTSPRVSTSLPGGHRIEGRMGGSVESGVSVAIRVYRPLERTLTDFGLDAAAAAAVADVATGHGNILVSGGTGTGKTTFLNSLLRLIPTNERVVTMEDSRELVVTRFQNRAALVVDRHNPGNGWKELFDHAMRIRPDRIIAGEVSLSNVLPIINLMDTGHRGFMATVHANNCQEAVDNTFYMRLSLAGQPQDRHNLSQFLRRNLDLVIQLRRLSDNTKRVVELWFPATEERPRSLVD